MTRSLFAEPLISVGWDGKPTPRLVSGWEWGSTGRTLRLQLRTDVQFHDGSKLTSHDAVAVLRQALKARGASYSGGLEHVESLEARDDSTIEFRLGRPDGFLLHELANAEIVKLGQPSVGTGPFRIVSRGPALRFEKFGDYHRGTPALDSITIQTYETHRGAWAALMRGEVDMVQDVTRESVEFLEKQTSSIRTYSSIRPYYVPLVMNLSHPILKRVEVRRALSEAINRDQIVENAMRRRGKAADDPIWPFHWAYSAAARRYSYNPDAASLRLDVANLPIRSIGPGRMDSRFTFTCLFWSEDPVFERIALVLQRQLAAIGVDAVLQPVTYDALVRRIQAGDFDAFLMTFYAGRSFDWTYRAWHSPRPGGSRMHDSGYAGADAILDRLRSANSDAETRSAVADLQQKLYEDAPAIFLAWRESTRAVSSDFTLGEQNEHDIFANVWKWRPANPLRASR